jgi:hypothetical protein
MDDIFVIEFPSTMPKSEVEALEQEFRSLNGVEDAGLDDSRSVDLVAAGIWIKLVADALGAVNSGIPIVQQISQMIRGKGIKGAKITFADGTSASFDEISAKDLEKLLLAANQKSGSHSKKRH